MAIAEIIKYEGDNKTFVWNIQVKILIVLRS